MPSPLNPLRIITSVLALASLISALPTGNSSFALPPIRKIARWEGCSKGDQSKLKIDFDDVVRLTKYAGNINKNHKA